MKKDFLDSLHVDSPCRESWEEMTGGDQVRFCSHCAKDIHDLSAMPRAEAEKLVKNSNGRLCVRLVKTPRGKTVTAPPALTRIKRRARFAASALAASIALSAHAYAQQTEPSERLVNWTQTVKKLSKTGGAERDFSIISGTVRDANEGVIAGAKVTLRSAGKQKMLSARTGEDGVYEFARVAPDVYEIEIESPGFKKLSVSDIVVSENEKIEQSAVLEVGATMGVIVIADDPQRPTGESEINQTVQPQPVSELPRNPRRFFLGLVAGVRSEEKPKVEKSQKNQKKKK
ncbi:MAG TPA: carboxypeptidase-like regulatory domain-containing protein [Pyrinomonadaceae bacterium]|jgi:hypothetical protein